MATADSPIDHKSDDFGLEDEAHWEDLATSDWGPSMNEVIPKLWLGEYGAATNPKLLREKNVKYILSAIGYTQKLDPTFINYQVELQDTEYADLLIHLPPSIAFIESALESGNGILVHCMAGVSRSPSIVAAYLMYSKKYDLDTAMAIIRMARPIVGPNRSFMKQLRLFEAASYQVNKEDKGIRGFYLERAVASILKGGAPSNDVFADYVAPQTSNETGEPPQPERRIRCKMCRQEVATRVNMMHLGPKSEPKAPLSQPTSSALSILQPLRAARTSASVVHTLIGKPQPTSGTIAESDALTGALGVEAKLNSVDQSLSKFAVGEEEAEEDNQNTGGDEVQKKLNDGLSLQGQTLKPTDRMPSTPIMALKKDILAGIRSRPVIPPISRPPVPRPGTIPSTTPVPVVRASGSTENPPPPLCGTTCSGYFLEPMKWMDPFLQLGELEGRIICPNAKCNAKLGNYAWAGVHCSCGDWVTPGFCVAKAKVDEI